MIWNSIASERIKGSSKRAGQDTLLPTSNQAMYSRWLSYLLIGLAVTLGLLYAWAAAVSHSMNADGISYLDMGDAYMRGDWEMALDSVWSPLYAWVLGAVMRLVDPPMHLEFPVVHVVNFTIYLFALLCFVYFWRQVMHYHKARAAREGVAVLPAWAFSGLGYTLFIASSLVLIEIWSVTPDMLMAAFVYVAAALVLRIRLGDHRWRTFVLLGLVLGLGYLAKAIMFPLSILFLAAALFAVRDLRVGKPRILAAFFVFSLICLPYIAVLTATKGEFAASGAGKFTYAKHVNGVPFAHWQGETPGNGTPVHPSRQIFEEPPVFEFGTPIGGTYPVSYDPSYWYEGLEIYFDLEQQAEALLASFVYYYEVFIGLFGALVFSLVVFYLMGRRPSWRLTDIFSDWGLLFIALSVLAFYAIVLVAGRYIGAFIVLFFAVLLANVSLPDTVNGRKIAAILSGIAIVIILGNVLVSGLSGYRDFSNDQDISSSAAIKPGPPSWPDEVAEELRQLGIQEGDEVGIIGYGFDSFWARLARVRIVAELLSQDADPFWLGDAALQSEVIQTFAQTGAKAIVAENVPIYASLDGWHQLGNSNYYIYQFSQ